MRTFSIVIVVANRQIRKRRKVAVVKTKVIVAVVNRVAVETKRMMIKIKERIRRKAAVQVVLVVKRKQMIAIKEKMSIRMMKEEDDKEDDKDNEEGVKDKEDDKVEDDKAENEEDERHDKNEEAGDRVVEE